MLAVALSLGHQWGALRQLARQRARLARLVLAALVLSGNWLTYVWAVGHDRIVETALGYFIAPLATMLIGILLFGEVASPLRRVALGLAAVAIVVLVVAYGELPFVAVVLASTWSMYGALKRGIPLSPLQSLGGETFVLVIPAALVVVAAGARDDLLTGATGAQWVYVGFAGLVTAIPLLLFAAAARTVPFTILGPAQLPRARRSTSCSAWSSTTRRSTPLGSSGSPWCGSGWCWSRSMGSASAARVPPRPSRAGSDSRTRGGFRAVDRAWRTGDLRQPVDAPRPHRHRDPRRAPLRAPRAADAVPRRRASSSRIPRRGVLLLWRHRFTTDTWGWEVPAGRIDPGESPERGRRTRGLRGDRLAAGSAHPPHDVLPVTTVRATPRSTCSEPPARPMSASRPTPRNPSGSSGGRGTRSAPRCAPRRDRRRAVAHRAVVGDGARHLTERRRPPRTGEARPTGRASYRRPSVAVSCSRTR